MHLRMFSDFSHKRFVTYSQCRTRSSPFPPVAKIKANTNAIDNGRAQLFKWIKHEGNSLTAG